ncbi:MAG: type II toxin-antitoxin system RelB/DinJ family antitoxin [Candidatus Wallbacteria bacterium]|nr:type II toxin-antitoxin system RelB/DinJ family antitoxin [Candidatus Wallbacteria bacterium]
MERTGKSRKSDMIRARVNPELKKKVEAIFEKLGLSATDAITIFYHQVELFRGLPFEIRIPNTGTRTAMDDLDSDSGCTVCRDLEDFRKKIGG